MKIFSKVSVGVLSLALAFSVTSGVSAQAMSYADLIKAFVAAGIISADKAAMATALVSGSASASFTKDLTVGSSGAEVTALQKAVGVANPTGYFGSATKAAVQKFQASKGISATGFVGPLTRAALNGSVAMTTPGTVVTVPGTVTPVNTGVEGTLTVERTSVPNTTVYEGDSMKAVLAIKVQAKVSDINVQRIKLNLGDSTSFYTKVFKTLYVVDDSGKVLVQADLNSNTVVKDSSNYFITLGGFSYNVAKDTTKYLTVKADVYSSVKAGTAASTICNGTGHTCTITLPIDGVRGVDGAGIDQLSPASAISQSVSITGNLAESASVDLSTNTANYKASDVVAKDGTANNELDGLALLSFDLIANKADVKVTDLNVTVTGGTTGATTTTIYLYDGSTLLQSESVDLSVPSVATATFNDITGLVLTKDVKKTLTVKADVRSANSVPTTISASVSSASFVAENMVGTAATVSGSATGENMIVRSIGPVFTLTAPTMSAAGRVQNQAGSIATTTGTANFTINATALGGDISFGSAASTTGLFGTNGLATTTTTWLSVYKDSVANGSISANTAAGEVAKIAYAIPSTGVTTVGETFTLSKGSSVSIPVTVTFPVAGLTQSSYAIQINGIRWSNSSTGQQTSASMLNKSEWRTPGVGLP